MMSVEERNEELHKLRKKNTANVQVLTHFKEKLQFVVAENTVVRSELADLDDDGVGRERAAGAAVERRRPLGPPMRAKPRAKPRARSRR